MSHFSHIFIVFSYLCHIAILSLLAELFGCSLYHYMLTVYVYLLYALIIFIIGYIFHCYHFSSSSWIYNKLLNYYILAVLLFLLFRHSYFNPASSVLDPYFVSFSNTLLWFSCHWTHYNQFISDYLL